MELHHQRLKLRHIARLLAAPFSTVARSLNRLGFGRLRNLEPKPAVQRYAGLIQSLSPGLLSQLSAWVEVGGIASSLCSRASLPQPISI